jgi:hypothetical protein
MNFKNVSKKPGTKDYLLCDSIFVKYPDRANLETKKEINCCLGLEVKMETVT